MNKLIDDLVSDRAKFNEFVYTPLDRALASLDIRTKDPNTPEYLKKTLPFGIPEPLKTERSAVLFRQVVTPNYELRRFISLVDGMENFKPIIIEYHEDKFTDNNEFKYHLGMLAFFHGKGKKGGEKIDFLNCIDFNSCRGKKLSEIKMKWGQSLIDFHHELLSGAYLEKHSKITLFDASKWFSESGNIAKNYYKSFLSLFLQDDILFENFMLDTKELSFTREIFLPAFMSIEEETGVKPLIVALEPTDVESDIFWMCHPSDTKPIVESRLNTNKIAI